MPISITCSNCDKTLKVPDEVAGKKVRCPACKAVLAVPAVDEDIDQDEDEAPPPKKKKSEAVKPEKAAPLPRKRRDDDDDEEPEDRDEDEEEERPKKKKKRRDDDEDDDDDISIRRRKPHRGSTILTMGIASILTACCCPLIAFVVGGITLNMANTDLALMKSKKMDREGQSNTNTGKICAIVGLVLGAINAIAGIALRVTGNM